MTLTYLPEYSMAINLVNIDCVIVQSNHHTEASKPEYCLNVYMRGTGPITISHRQSKDEIDEELSAFYRLVNGAD